MNEGTRACIAYVAGEAITGVQRPGIYDYSRTKHLTISGNINGSRADFYDHSRGCHFGGSFPNLYDYGVGSYVSLQTNGNEFSGYDYGAGCHFSGSVNGHLVNVYDFSESSNYTFSL